jgi:hypothetical protein
MAKKSTIQYFCGLKESNSSGNSLLPFYRWRQALNAYDGKEHLKGKECWFYPR